MSCVSSRCIRVVSRRRSMAVAITLGLLAFPSAVLALLWHDGPAAVVFELGPVDLHAGANHHAVRQPRPLPTVFAHAGWIRGFDLTIESDEVRPVPREVLHHVKLIMPDRRDLFSPQMLHLIGAGSETSALLLPHFLGQRVEVGDSLLFTAMLHNPTSSTWHGVRIRLRVRYTPRTWPRPIDVRPFFLHVTQPGTPGHYDLPPGESQTSWTASPAIAGRILGIGGHIHRFGTGLRMEDLTTGQQIWDARIERDSDGRVTRIPRTYFFTRFGTPIRPDHVYRVTAFYDNPTGDTLREAGMGTVAGILRPDASNEWPLIDRDHPVYRFQLLEEWGAHALHTAGQH